MNIAIVGSGYVGLVTGACFAEMGVGVTCVDIDAQKIESLRKGIIPIYEPGLEDIVVRNLKAGRLAFSTSLEEALTEVEVVFCAVGTPPMEDYSADLTHVLDVARQIGRLMERYVLLVTKSTVPVGTTHKVRELIARELELRGVEIPFDVASNPEFLKEGKAVEDFMMPDRVVVGVENERVRHTMEQLYKPFMIKNSRIIFTDIKSSEMIKYAANTMLATRISFMNEIAGLCERVGADVEMVRKGIGADSRIGSKFLYAGVGYGGSCFPKDIKALVRTGEENGCSMDILRAVVGVNERQRGVLVDKLKASYPELEGKTVGLWGLSFKPETDDMRDAPSLVIVEKLLQEGCRVKVYDPAAMEQARRYFGSRVVYCDDMYEAAEGADALMMLTEWKQFRMPSWVRLGQIMNRKLMLDGRNIYERATLEDAGFTYLRIG